MNFGVFQKGDIVSAFCEEYQTKLDATIVEFRQQNQQAYVHFIKQDKRLDRWMDVGTLERSMDSISNPTDERVLTRNQRKQIEGSDEEDSVPNDCRQFEKIHKEVTKIRNVDQITIGSFTIRTWYFSPYPHPYHNMDHLYICEQCFHYFGTQQELLAHQSESRELCPPGREIYREGNVSIFELKGWRQKVSCQCLCLLSKLFLDHKTLFYDVEGFIFYVLCECDQNGAHIAAYFSRELNSADGNILACITTLPPYQKKGYGRLLISLSYEIAKRLRRSGGPERPLSDLGKIAFHSYWRDTLLDLLNNRSAEIATLDDLVTLTAIDKNDIIDTLKEFNYITKVKGEYELNFNKENTSAISSQYDVSKARKRIDPSLLIWLPGDDDRN